MRKISLFILGVVTCVSLSAQEKLEKKVIGNGSTKADNGTVKLNGTLGQTFIGLTQSTTIKAKIGFWETVLEEVSTAVIEVDYDTTPSEYFLGQNYPNPADQQTLIPIEVSENADISVQLYSIQGQALRDIHKQEMSAGKYILSTEVSHLPVGQYKYVLRVDGKIIAVKSMFIVH